VTHVHTQPGVADQFLADVRAKVADLMKDPEKPVEGRMAIYGVAQAVPDRSIVGDFTKCFLDSMYYTPPVQQ
jgi:sphinganine-1-phosphate aldolase